LNRTRAATDDLINIQRITEAIDRSAEDMLLERMKISQYISTGEAIHVVDAESMRRSRQEEWKFIRTQSEVAVQDMIQNIDRVHETYEGLLDKVVAAYKKNPKKGAVFFAQLNDTDQFYTNIVVPADRQLRKWNEASLAKIRESVRVLTVRALTIFAISGLIALIVSVAAASIISLGIVRSATHLSRVAESISRGDLDTTIEVTTGDEMEELGRSIERMRVSLQAAIERLRIRRAGS
jgi:methyl-accepting chemotaxis protein